MKILKVNKTNAKDIASARMQHVEDTQALVRHTDGEDYKITERHRIVLTALFNKLSKRSVA